MALGNLIKTWENIMRDDDGVNGTVQVLSQLVWMLFLKVYDLKEDMWEIYEDDFVSAIPENCRWRNWAKGKSQKERMTGDVLVNFVDNTLFPTLKQLKVTAESSRRTSIVRDMMAESYNYMKDGVCIRKAVNLLDGIDFEDQEELHAFNVIYETLLKGLQSAGRSGEFYTPRAITQFITEKVDPKLGKITADFACGTGGFLVDAVEHLRKQVKRAEDNAVIERTVFGVEKKQFPYMLCTTNMLLHNVDYPRVSHANSLAKNVREYKPWEKVDFVLMNPPYGGHEQNGVRVNFPSKLRSSETANLFMIEILYRLNNDGRCGVVLPDGFLQNDDASLIAVKKKLFAECNVHTIIRLPGSCFSPYTPIATNLFFFDKTGSTEETWFYRFDLPDGQKFSMKKNPIVREKLSAIDEWWENRQEIKDEKEDESLTDTWKAKCVPIGDIVEGNYNLDFCGYPNKEKVILSPEETLETYETTRAHLEKKLAFATAALKDALMGKSSEPKNIAEISSQLSVLNAEFPQNMKASILQAAMQGKLTEQLSSDTPVESMFPKIQIEKQRIMRNKNIRNSYRKSSEIEYYDTVIDIPNEWIMCRLDDLCYVIPTKSYQVQDKEVLAEGTYPVVSQSVNLVEGYHNDVNKLLKNDDVILVFGDHSKTLKYVDFDFIVGADGTKLIAPVGIHPKFLYYALMYNIVNMPDRGYARHFGILKRMRIPFPPIEEQQRIVERLDALLPLCENL